LLFFSKEKKQQQIVSVCLNVGCVVRKMKAACGFFKEKKSTQ
jgi:hypothetical protein